MALRKSRRSPGNLPQYPETWHVAIHELRIWIAPDDEEPYRPFVVAVLNLEIDFLQLMDLSPDLPTPEQVLSMLMKAIKKPDKKSGQKPHRPRQIQFEEAALTADLGPELEQIGIDVIQQPRPVEVRDLIANLELHMGGAPELHGLLSIKGATPELVGGLFAAAAEFYQAAPWVHLTDQHTLAIRVSPEKEARFVQVMGGGGVEYGLAMYRRWEDVERVFGFADNTMEMLPPDGGHSLLFHEINMVPFDDLDAIEQYGWPVANPHAYPTPLVFTPQREAKRPARADLLWYEAALRVIPIFVRDYFQTGKQEEIEFSLSVATHTGETEVHIKYPAGTLPLETRPADMMDWPGFDEDEEDLPQFDRRAMEGKMSPFATGFDDPNLQEAQELMYQAWEERNPARRLILAHEALSLSPLCTDAYVLLAEEEADTIGRALEYYRKGVEAGEQALGADYFEENAGHFWGIMETRPYMRARQGLANTLWELNHHDEALDHYREMLRLNPGDNQGIRYTLLNLLMTLNRDAEALSLLKEYDDAMAEWLYTRALLIFREAGASEEAKQSLQAALGMNPHVPIYLTGQKRIPLKLPSYIGFGDENEAATYSAAYLPIWRRTPGAIDWLQGHLKPSRKTGPHKRSKRRRGKRRLPPRN